MSIVPVTEGDWALLKNIRLESLQDSPDAFGITYAEAKEIPEGKWKSLASGVNDLKFFFYRTDNEIIGLVGGVLLDGEYELVSMWVKPDQRKIGVGFRLAKELLAHAKSHGYSSVVLSVSVNNQAAYRLYSKIGFRVVEEKYSGSRAELKKMVWRSASEP
ncbi:GNAT family N-acetyltransferase [Microbulbifer agarilyticus]|uniref:GNAT family N-acetyltransferase n=1 Tax=Microbulbifer agarilyticus TaxID=260552 RepID=UPI001CD56315|nr:GNAT family N-acetyltransferase [Microbulbifer agarilyticus]MCA0902222.1 GNAT family N-acetyltransferase [Microbulbifer agarilyticus]